MRKMTTGYYIPTPSFKSIPEHIAVMYEDDQTLVAICGPADDEHVAETTKQARVFSVSFELLEVLQNLCDGYSAAFEHYELPEFLEEEILDKARAAIAKARGEA